MLKQFGVSPNEIYQEDFLKGPVLNRSAKGATLQGTLFIAFYQRKANINEILKQFGVKLIKFIRKNTCAGDFFKYSCMAEGVQRY